MLSRASCKNTEAINIDFLNIDPSDARYADVTHMSVIAILDGSFAYLGSRASLLDPSCSGSGIVNRLDHLLESGRTSGNILRATLEFFAEQEENEEQEERLSKLAAFQLMVIKHAMKCR